MRPLQICRPHNNNSSSNNKNNLYRPTLVIFLLRKTANCLQVCFVFVLTTKCYIILGVIMSNSLFFRSEERFEPPKASHSSKAASHPSTPNPLGSPGAASMSSFHDGEDNVSSPSLPKTPASPAVNESSKSSTTKVFLFLMFPLHC